MIINNKKNKKGQTPIIFISSEPVSKLQQATWISTLLVNTLILVLFAFFVWAIWSVGNSNIKNYSEQHCYNGSNSADINCLMAI